MMPRNLERRVEILFPILNPELKEKVRHVLEVQLRDNIKAQFLKPDGTYAKTDKELVTKENACSAQEQFCREYRAEAAMQEKEIRQARVFKPEYKQG